MVMWYRRAANLGDVDAMVPPEFGANPRYISWVFAVDAPKNSPAHHARRVYRPSHLGP
jgi:hypothetical protein